jgi:hypothetical protein
VLLILGWGLLPALNMFRRSQGQVVGTIREKDVTRNDLMDARGALHVALVLGLTDPWMALRAAGGGSLRARSTYAVLAGQFRRFIFPDTVQIGEDSVWRFVVLLREARAARVEASPGEVTDLLTGVAVLSEAGQFSRRRYQSFLAQTGYTDAQVSRWFGQLASVAKLIGLKASAAVAAYPEVWQAYAFRSERARIRYVELDGELFASLGEAPLEELRAFYEEHKDRLPGAEDGAYGYMAPERVKVEYAVAPLDRIASEMDVAETDIAAYYEDHREDYAVDVEEAAEQGGEEEATEDAKQQYKPLGEVRGEIRRRLARQRAEEEALRRVGAALDDLAEAGTRYGNAPQPLGQMARRHGLQYRLVSTPTGREFVSREELSILAPAGERLAEFAFSAERSLYVPTRITPSEGPYVVCQVLGRREPEVQSFEAVQQQVRSDYLEQTALDRAVKFAQKLKGRAEQVGLRGAGEEFEARLRALVGGSTAGSGGEDRALLEVRESESFTRMTERVPGIGRRVPGVVARAFGLDPGQLALVREGPPVSRVYVMEVTERRPARPDELAQEHTVARVRQQYLKQRHLLDTWFEGLLAAAERSTAKPAE